MCVVCACVQVCVCAGTVLYTASPPALTKRADAIKQPQYWGVHCISRQGDGGHSTLNCCSALYREGGWCLSASITMQVRCGLLVAALAQVVSPTNFSKVKTATCWF